MLWHRGVLKVLTIISEEHGCLCTWYVSSYAPLKLYYMSPRMHGVVTRQTTKWSVRYPEIQIFSAVCTLRCIYLAVSEINTRQRDLQSVWFEVCVFVIARFLFERFAQKDRGSWLGSEACLRPSLLWGVVRCRVAVGNLQKRSSKVGPTCAETSLINLL